MKYCNIVEKRLFDIAKIKNSEKVFNKQSISTAIAKVEFKKCQEEAKEKSKSRKKIIQLLMKLNIELDTCELELSKIEVMRINKEDSIERMDTLTFDVCTNPIYTCTLKSIEEDLHINEINNLLDLPDQEFVNHFYPPFVRALRLLDKSENSEEEEEEEEET